MFSQNIFFLALKSIVVDIIGDVLYFPIWWYTVGLKDVVIKYGKSVSETANHLALRLLVLNIFKPMFAQYDRAGRVISFFMRVVILIGRSIYFVVYVVLRFSLVCAWVALPILIVMRILTLYVSPYVS